MIFTYHLLTVYVIVISLMAGKFVSYLLRSFFLFLYSNHRHDDWYLLMAGKFVSIYSWMVWIC